MAGRIDNDRFKKLLEAFPSKAIEVLYGMWFEKLVMFSVRYTHDRQVSQDIVQEAFVCLWKNRSRFCNGHHQSVRTFLYTVVRNKSMSSYKHRFRREMRQAKFLMKLYGNGSEAPSVIVEKDHRGLITELLKYLPDRERECIFLQSCIGLSVRQISRYLNISGKAVEGNLYRARKRMRKFWLMRTG